MAPFRPTKCRRCGKRLVVRNGKYGKFLGCTGYPKCKYTFDLPNKRSKDKISCPKCDIIVFKRREKDGEYLICKRYPKCSFKIPMKERSKTKIKCPECRKKMTILYDTSGWILKCNNSPKCAYIFNLETGKPSYLYSEKDDKKKKKIFDQEPILNTEKILQAITPDLQDIKKIAEKLTIIDQIDIGYLKNKLKEFERKRYITKILVEDQEFWKKDEM